MTADELIEQLKQIRKEYDGDTECVHIKEGKILNGYKT